MYRILLADNEGIVLDALKQMLYKKFGESCDIRTARTAAYTRTLARKFVPDIAIIDVEMPGLQSFDIVREIRSYHMKCVFITVSTYDRPSYRVEAKSLNILAHITKPLFREKVMPVIDQAASIVAQAQKRLWQNRMIQEKFDTVVPVLEHGFINQLFFPESYPQALTQYKLLLDISQNYGRIVTLTFGEIPESGSRMAAPESSRALQNLVGCAVRLEKNDIRFREIVLEHFPLTVIGPVMGNHVLFLIPSWNDEETAAEQKNFSSSLKQLTEALEDAFDGLRFFAESGPIKPLAELPNCVC